MGDDVVELVSSSIHLINNPGGIPGGGTVTQINTVSPLSGGPIVGTGSISIADYTNITRGTVPASGTNNHSKILWDDGWALPPGESFPIPVTTAAPFAIENAVHANDSTALFTASVTDADDTAATYTFGAEAVVGGAPIFALRKVGQADYLEYDGGNLHLKEGLQITGYDGTTASLFLSGLGAILKTADGNTSFSLYNDKANGDGDYIFRAVGDPDINGEGGLYVSDGNTESNLRVKAYTDQLTNLSEWYAEGASDPATVIAPDGIINAPSAILTNVTAPVDAVASFKTLDSTAPNADLTLTAITKGILSPPITITVVVGAALAPLSIVTTGTDIVVTLASTTGIVGTSTANDVKGIIDGDTGGAADLVTVVVEGSGAGIVDAFSIQTLSGGVDGTAGSRGTIISASGQPYFCTADATVATAGAWKKISLASL